MTECLRDAGSVWGSVVWPGAWQAAIVGLLAWGLSGWLGRWSPSAGLVAAAAGLIKFVMPGVVQSPVAFVDAAARQAPTPLAGSGPLMAAVAALHVGGALLGVAALVIRSRRLRRLGDEASPAPRAWQATCEALAEELAWPSRRGLPALRVSRATASPMAFGVLRPVILLPEGLTTADARTAIAHELAHHRHHDLRVEWGLALLTACWWWHPVAWLLARRVRGLREQRADGAVVDAGIASAGEYCEALVRIARGSTTPTLAAGVGHPLARRVRRLLERPAPSRRRRVLLLAAAWAFLLTGAPHAARWTPLPGRAASHAADQSIVVQRLVSVVTTRHVR
ncbi:MAG: M56 family metallopeptidase [Vicinamibacterales bacterium]